MAQYKHAIDTLKDPFPEIAQMLKDGGYRRECGALDPTFR